MSEKTEYEEGKKVGRAAKPGTKMPDGMTRAWKDGWEDGMYPSEARSKNPYENGRQKAQQEIANKWPVLNAGKMFDDSRHPSKLVEAYLVKKGHSPELARKQASNMSSDELDTVVKQNGL